MQCTRFQVRNHGDRTHMHCSTMHMEAVYRVHTIFNLINDPKREGGVTHFQLPLEIL